MSLRDAIDQMDLNAATTRAAAANADLQRAEMQRADVEFSRGGIDPVLVTLAAAALTGLAHDMLPAEAAKHAVKYALATRAALREAGDNNQNGDTK